jgi:hypothetical protein
MPPRPCVSDDNLAYSGNTISNFIKNIPNKGLNLLFAIYHWILLSGTWVLGGFIGMTNFIQKFLLKTWISMMDHLGRRRIIMDREGDEPYLERYYLFLPDRDENFPFNIFIHKFLKGDSDNLHDHPWGFFTLILSGGYWEHVYTDEAKSKTKRVWRAPGYWQKVEAEHIHRIELKEGNTPCWTLFIPFKRERVWGFWKPYVDLVENEDKPKDSAEWIESDQYFLDRQNKKEN